MLVEVNHSLVQQENNPKVQRTEEEIEDILSEKLLEGYELIEKSCPECSTPLIKMNDNSYGHQGAVLNSPVCIPNRNPEKPFNEIEGVPNCVNCNVHVVTQENEMNLIEKNENGNEDSPVIDLTDENEVTIEYSVRREIATKVLGAKLLQGYVLKQEQCDDCGMPQMELNGQIDCVVCPALAKKAAKEKKKASQEMNEDKASPKGLQVQSITAKEAEATFRHPGSPEMAPDGPPSPVMIPHPPRNPRDIMLQREHQAKVEEEYLATEQKRREEEMILIEETKRLAALEDEYTVGSIRTTDYMQRDLLLEQHRSRLATKVKLDEDILKLEQMRLIEEMEYRRLTEEKRTADEADRINKLEKEAEARAKAAEEASECAKKALEDVEAARKDILAQTIAMAEAEVVAEAESVLYKDVEDYKERTILPTTSEINAEHWETLRVEGRAVMTRRVMSGWTIIAEFCRGEECENSPLIMKRGKKECVVCGGCGDGYDGAYAISQSGSMDSEEGTLDETIAHTFMSQTHLTNTISSTNHRHLQSDFETKRDMVSHEISKKMTEGWTLLDATCPTCVMPLMADDMGKSDICVLCDMVGNHMTFAPPSSVPDFKAPAVSSRYMADPPTNVTSADASESAESVTISIPKDFDFSDPAAVKDLMSKYAPAEDLQRKPEPTGEKPGFLEPTSVAGGYDKGDIIDLSTLPSMDERDENGNIIDFSNPKNHFTIEKVAKMFMDSPIGSEAKVMGARIDMIELLDLVDIYATANFADTKWNCDGHKQQVASFVWGQFSNSSELPTSPVAEVPGTPTRRLATTPTTRSRLSPRSGLPPKPESRSGTTPVQNRTPKTGRSTDNGHFDFNDDASSITEASAAANMTLENILFKIEKCKETLKDETLSVDQQMSAAALIEKLSKAALAVQGLDDFSR